jgi:uncharacterized protein YkwD
LIVLLRRVHRLQMLRVTLMATAFAATLLAALVATVAHSTPREAPRTVVRTPRLAGPPPMTSLLAAEPAVATSVRRGLQLDVHSVVPVPLSIEEAAEAEGTPEPVATAEAEATLESTVEATAEAEATPAPTPTQAAGLLDLAHAYIDLQRALFGLAPLARSAALDAVASAHAQDLAATARFSHTGSDGGTLADRLARGGVDYGWAGENLGRSAQADVDSVRAIVSGFMNSPAHRANVLGPAFNSIGLALSVSVDGSAILVVVFSD